MSYPLGHQAARAVSGIGDGDEGQRELLQPVREVVGRRAAVGQPLALDESLVTLGDALRLVADRACEVVGLKVGRVGGLTPARRIRDVCLEAGIRMNVEDTGGTRLSASAAVHLAQTVPEPFRRATWLCFDHLTVDPVVGGAVNDGGWSASPSGVGIGAEPDEQALGEPLATFEEV